MDKLKTDKEMTFTRKRQRSKQVFKSILKTHLHIFTCLIRRTGKLSRVFI